jgi:phosphoglycerate dehydrogenase-like enzyme
MRVIFHYAAGPALAARLAALPDLTVTVCSEFDDAKLMELLPEADVLWHVLKPATAEMMAMAPKLRLIQKIGVGVNTIDLEAAKSRGIAVCNLPGTNARAVAELTLALMLATLRRFAAVRRSNAQRPCLVIGSYCARQPGGAWGPHRRIGWVRSCAAPAGSGAHSARLQVVVHSTPSASRCSRMRRGAVLINTARGGLVDQVAPTEALRDGRLAGAGLDVFAEEPVNPAEPLLRLPNVVVSPHVGWLTTGTFDRSFALAAENCRRLAIGETLLHRVA